MREALGRTFAVRRFVSVWFGGDGGTGEVRCGPAGRARAQPPAPCASGTGCGIVPPGCIRLPRRARFRRRWRARVQARARSRSASLRLRGRRRGREAASADARGVASVRVRSRRGGQARRRPLPSAKRVRVAMGERASWPRRCRRAGGRQARGTFPLTRRVGPKPWTDGHSGTNTCKNHPTSEAGGRGTRPPPGIRRPSARARSSAHTDSRSPRSS